ncbi:F510_1955 family glycosylhydrolase [Kineococcus esterisolvens]|uniref:F510_1955 family glycosylhydrolase n=1 Tax=unclassified Kineococcus TaxID=2621656 RepID=UPI003D7E4766
MTLPSAHVHGVGVDPADGLVHLASHDGLFRFEPSGPVRVGPVIDLMGFSIAGPDHFYASGHPGPGTDLPDPVGLIESRDGGATWTPLSREGESDFHALDGSSAGVVGFDGALRASTDGREWTSLEPPVRPYSLAVSADARTIVVTSESGPARSTDAGRTWAQVPQAPLLVLVDFVQGGSGGSEVVGVTPDGVVAVSEDAGATWRDRGRIDGSVQAISGTRTDDGELQVVVVDGETILRSTDGGRSFSPLPG